MNQEKGKIGSSFEDYLAKEGLLEETTALALKRVLAWQLAQAMAEKGISKAQMAKSMHTSRSQLDRILDPENQTVQLDSILKAARAVGRQLRIELI